MRLEPILDRVVILPATAPDKSEGGIVLPDQAKQRPTRGTVVAVGPGKHNNAGVFVNMTLVPGDEVLYSTYSGSDIEHDGLTYKLMREDDILAKVLPKEDGEKKAGKK